MKRPEVERADRICALIKGDDDIYRTEEELIEGQEELMDEDEEPEDEDDYRRPLPHSMDSHSSGSFIYTPRDKGINPNETTLTRLSEHKKR